MTKPNSKFRTILKSILIWALIIVPLVLLLAVVSAWFVESSALDAELAALRAAGQPTTAAEINDFYVVPAGVTDTTALWVKAIDGVMAADVSERGKTLPYFGLENDTPVPPPGAEWAQLEESRAFITEMDEELQAIWRAAKAGGQARYPVDFSPGFATLLPYTQNSRQVARLLSLDAHVAAHDGDNARALQDIKAIFALSDSLRGEPILISLVARIGIHSMGHSQVEELVPYCEWSDAELQSLQAAVQSAQFKQEYLNGLCGERATCLSALDTVPLGPFRKSNKLEALRQFKRCIDGLDGTWAESLASHREVSAEIKSMMGSKLQYLRLSDVLLIFPAVEQVTIAGGRAAARQKTAIIAIAAQRHRLKHGQLPTSLSEIDPALLGSNSSSLFSDPFTDKQLLFKSDETKIIVYSVGNNGRDDGGNVDLDNVPRDKQDIGFMLQR